MYLKHKYGEKHYKDHVYKFADRTNVGLTHNKMLDVSLVEDPADDVDVKNGTFSPNPTIYIIEIGDKSPSCNIYKIKMHHHINSNTHSNIHCHEAQNSIKMNPLEQAISKIHNQYRSSTISDIRSSCKLFQEFNDGTLKLDKDTLEGLASNLIHVESGSARFKEILNIHSYGNYEQWKHHLSYMKKMDHQPSPCNKYCPHRNQCQHAKDILTTTKSKYHQMERLYNHNGTDQFASISDVEKDFKYDYMSAMNAKDTHIHVLNYQLGLGKSTTVINYMKNNRSMKLPILAPIADCSHALGRYYF
jgi:hypothetical protein